MKSIILFLLVSSTFFAQNNSITVTYKIANDEPLMSKSEKAQNPSIVSVFDEVEKVLPTIEFELLLCNNKSKFYQIDALAINNTADKIARTLVDDAEYYIDFKSNTFECLRHFRGEEFRVEFIPISDWQITTETKLIDNYLCFKATTKRTEKTEHSVNTFDVIAWFAPSIQVQGGPKQFYNLPGLILELKDARITYLATKIKFNSDSICLNEIVTKKELLSIDEYKLLIEKRVQNFKSSITN
jgi:GLPGLI family protein